MVKKRRCPKCNEFNEIGLARCAHCGADLIQICPICGTPRPWYVARCPQCEARPDDMALFAELFVGTPRRVLHRRYEIKATLAKGRVTAVYRAVDTRQPGRVCAVKRLSSVMLFRADERRRAERNLERALERWGKVHHLALVSISDHFVEGDSHYVVFDFVQGWSGKRIIEEPNVRVTPELARNWGAQICDLLQVLHDQSPSLHVPFLAPEHIIVTPEGRIHLVGLGLGALFAPTAYGPYGSVRGYAPPELASGAFPSVRTDIFALGRLLYALLIDRLLEKGLAQPLPLRRAVPGISNHLVMAIARAARRDPEQRYDSARELQEDLWDATFGPLEPIDHWYQQAKLERKAPVLSPNTVRTTVRVGGREDVAMEAFGFQRDPRFGPEPIPAVASASPPKEPRLSVYPHRFIEAELRADEKRKVVLTVRNLGDADLLVQLLSHVPWLKAPQRQVRLAPQKRARFLLTLDAHLLPSDRVVEPQALSVESNAGRQWIAFTAEAIATPVLYVSTTSIDLTALSKGEKLRHTLRIGNAGRQLLTGYVTAQVPWLRVAPKTFRCPPGQEAEITVELRPNRLPFGPQDVTKALLIDSDGGQQAIRVKAWQPRPILDINASLIDLGEVLAGEVVERLLMIGNKGDAPLKAQIVSFVPWLDVEPEQVQCGPGEAIPVTLKGQTKGLSDGSLFIPQAVQVRSNGGTQTLSLRMQVHAPHLVIRTEVLDFGAVAPGRTATSTLIVANEGSAGAAFALYPSVDWLRPPMEELVCEPGEKCPITIEADTSLFEQGLTVKEPSALRLVSKSEILDIPARMVIVQPSLRVEPEHIDFGYLDPSVPEQRTLTIHNAGTGELAWNLQTDALWLEIDPLSGLCAAGVSQTITLTAYGLGIDSDRGVEEAVLVVNSDGGRAKVPLRAALAAPLIATDSPYLDLGVSHNLAPLQSSFRIFNHGLGMLRGTLRTDQLWLVVDRASFQCAMGRSIEIGVRIDTAELPKGATEAEGRIEIESTGGDLIIEARLRIALEPAVTFNEQVVLRPAGGSDRWRGRLVLVNRGMATGHVDLVPSNAQLELSRSSVDIKPDKSVRIGIIWNGQAVPQEAPWVELRFQERRERVELIFSLS